MRPRQGVMASGLPGFRSGNDGVRGGGEIACQSPRLERGLTRCSNRQAPRWRRSVGESAADFSRPPVVGVQLAIDQPGRRAHSMRLPGRRRSRRWLRFVPVRGGNSPPSSLRSPRPESWQGATRRQATTRRPYLRARTIRAKILRVGVEAADARERPAADAACTSTSSTP